MADTQRVKYLAYLCLGVHCDLEECKEFLFIGNYNAIVEDADYDVKLRKRAYHAAAHWLSLYGNE